MNDATDGDTSRTAPSTPARAETCVGCGHITDQPTVVGIIEQSSGPGATLYACPGCAPRYRA
jgi:hypothetical protein